MPVPLGFIGEIDGQALTDLREFYRQAPPEGSWTMDLVSYLPGRGFPMCMFSKGEDTFDRLYAAYVRGGAELDAVLEELGFKSTNLIHIQDSEFNDILRGIYSDVGQQLVEAGVAEKLTQALRDRADR